MRMSNKVSRSPKSAPKQVRAMPSCGEISAEEEEEEEEEEEDDDEDENAVVDGRSRAEASHDGTKTPSAPSADAVFFFGCSLVPSFRTSFVVGAELLSLAAFEPPLPLCCLAPLRPTGNAGFLVSATITETGAAGGAAAAAVLVMLTFLPARGLAGCFFNVLLEELAVGSIVSADGAMI